MCVEVLRTKIEPIERIKPSEGWGIVLVAETQVPFPYSMCDVSSLLEVLGHDVHISWDARRHGRLDVHVLAAYSGVKHDDIE